MKIIKMGIRIYYRVLLRYNLRLPKRIGEDRILKLRTLVNIPKKYTTDQIKGLKVMYNLKIKQLVNQ